MKTQVATSILAIFGGITAWLAPMTSQAGNVGYHLNCSGQEGNPSTAIIAAGHTPVAVATLDAASLAPLQALVIESCGILPGNAALDAAISNGMGLLYDVIPGTTSPPPIPGMSGASITQYGCGNDVDPASGSPVTTGAGGTLTGSSLDGTNLCSYRGTISSGSLPASAIPFLTTSSPSNVIAFGYNAGQGRIAYSMSQFFAALPGGTYAGDPLAPGTMTFYTNVIAWITNAQATTCASEGYTGTKLTWCRNICESELPQATLDIWIHRWINRYRDLPYCAQEGGGEEEPPPQEA